MGGRFQATRFPELRNLVEFGEEGDVGEVVDEGGSWTLLGGEETGGGGGHFGR